MQHNLFEARALARMVRFSNDFDEALPSDLGVDASTVKNFYYSNELLISRDVTPGLFSSLQKVLKRLSIPNESVVAFVYPSPDLNAFCYPGLDDECVVRFSSALIDILTDQEFEFVIGHELGHFLLNHVDSQSQSSVEDMICQRAREVSADRLGLIGCDSLDVAIKALIKTLSGLGDLHLKFNVGSFISQLKYISPDFLSGASSSHPSMLVRSRALLWFSLCDSRTEKQLCSVDARIIKDMDEYVDGSARKIIEEAKKNLSMWTQVYGIIQKGSFSKIDQSVFREKYGESTLESLLSFIGDMDRSKLEDAVHKRVQEVRQDLEALIPRSFSKVVREMGLN